MGPADDVDGAGEGVAAVREVRDARGGRERPREAGGAHGAHLGRPSRTPEPAPREAARRKRQRRQPRPRPAGGADALGDFLTSREGKAVQKKVMRGVFGMLRKRL